MQSYTLYTTSEFLKDRHPYIPDPNPRPLMDPEQVAIAYNERAVPKLSDLLVYDKLSSEKRLAALHTLNELVSHQETKCDMITNRIVISATNLMKDENADVRFEASFLVGSLLFLDVGRIQFDSEKVNYEIMQKLIFDDVTKVRESIGWLLYRLSLHKDGTMMMNESNTISQIVLAFNKYSMVQLIEENVIYLLYLLEAIINCSRYDYNIRQTLGRGLLNSFNRILEDFNNDYSSKLSRGLYRQMRELILSACKNITLTFDGKREAYQENLIITCSKFLNSDLEKERLYTSSMFMSVTNILGAKNQICDFTDAEKYKEKMERRKDLARLTRNEKLIGKKRERKENYEGKDKEKILKREGNKSDSDIDDRVCGIYSNKISEQNDNTRQENTLKHDKEQYKNRNKQKLNVLEKLNKGIKDELFDEKLYLRDQDKNELDNTKIAEPYDKPLFNDKIRMSDIYKSYADDESKDYDKRTRELIKKQLEKGGHLFNNAGIDGLEMLKKGPIVFEKGGNL